MRHVLPARFSSVLIGLLTPCLPCQWAGEWPFDEKTGTVANDISGNANHGALKGFGTSPWVKGRFNNALAFDGVDDHVAVGIKKALPVYDGRGTPYTVAFWVKAPPQDDDRVYSEGSTATDRPIFTLGTGRTLRNNTGKLQVYIRNRENRVVCEQYTNATVFDDKWHHVAFVDVSGQITVYVDGVKDTAAMRYGTAPGAALFGTFDMNVASIGAVLRKTACCHLKGLIDDMRVYPFAVTQADVRLMMLGVPKTPCRPSLAFYGRGCGGTLGITATGSAKLGAKATFQLVGGKANANAFLQVGLGVQPLDISLAGFPGCVVYPPLAGSIRVAIGKLDATGASAKLDVTMPTQTSVACVIGSVQGVAISGVSLELSRVALVQLGN